MTNMHDIQGRQADRDKLQADVDTYVANGGKIEVLPTGFAPSDDDDADLIDV